MREAVAVLEDIYDALRAGEPPVVEATYDEGVWTVLWGVDGLMLSCPPAAARVTAGHMETEGYFPDVADMLITAADFCERDGASLH